MTAWMALSELMEHITGPSRSTVKALAQSAKIHARKVNAFGEESEAGRIWQIDTDDPTVATWLQPTEQDDESEFRRAQRRIDELAQECATWQARYAEAKRIIEEFDMLCTVKKARTQPKKEPLPTGNDLRTAVEAYLASCMDDRHTPTVSEFATSYTVSERTVRRRLTAAGIDYRAWRTRV